MRSYKKLPISKMLAEHERLPLFTPYQLEVFTLFSEGCTMKDVAARLNISPNAVDGRCLSAERSYARRLEDATFSPVE